MGSVTSGAKFKYNAYGLNIHSEVFLPELTFSNASCPDVTIYLDDVSLPVDYILDMGPSHISTEDSIYRFWDEIGIFQITNNSIIINPVEGLNNQILKNFLLGTVFATFLRFRGLYVLHASSVNIKDNAICFSGFKGFGKSTTAMTFYNKGFPVIADDYVTIKFDKNGLPIVIPGFGSVKLSFNSKNFMNLNIDKLNREQNIKTYTPVSNTFLTNPLPLKKIYILKRSDKTRIVELKPQESFLELVKNTFGIEMFSKAELINNFITSKKILNYVDVSLLEVNNSLKDLQNVVEIIEKDVKDESL